ncbi:zinc finger MYM-type protein 1-like [Mytilus trossulus]|uniref:zinc finger MYM-type protein 1-like n=1 Tax=Mytilus trossulus TaxID=6551 RepID=UPI003004D9AC
MAILLADLFGKKNRRFQATWLKDFHWMRYSTSTDSVFCAYCVLFTSEDAKEKSFSASAITDWKNLLSLARFHENLSQHRGSLIAGEDFLRVKKDKGDSVASMISSSHKKVAADNRYGLMKIFEVILLCGRQNIPIRGHVEERSNFIAILHEIARNDDKLSDWLAFRAGSRTTYLSPEIQNEIINIVGQQVQDSIIDACREAKYFAIIADECTDVSTKEQLSLCVRFLDKKNDIISIREEFIGFKHAKSVKGVAISNTIVKFLEHVNLDIRNLRAQCYDGAANMSGKYNGVQAKILEQSPEASYIHCKAHQLKLALVHSSKELCVRNMMSTVQEIAFKFDYSAKSLTAFTEELSENENVQDQLERRTKLRTLCETRWSSRADSLYTFRTAFEVVVSSLNSLKDDNDDKAAQSMNAILRFEFIISLVVAEHILSATVALTNYLQKTDIDLIESLTEAKIVIQRLSDERGDDTVWESLFARATDIAAEHDIQPSVPRVAGRQRHRANHPILEPSDYWRVSLYYVFLDHLVVEITKRLISNEERFLASYFIPAKLGNLTPEIADKIYNSYRSDLGDKKEFEDEITRWKARWSIEDNRPDRLLGVLNVTNADLYPSVYRIIWILLTMPVSSATSERSFSAMRRVKSYLRSTMGDERLSNLSLLHIHRHLNVDIDASITDFIGRKNRRLDFE